MNISKLIYSFFTALTAIFFLLIGIICLVMPWFSAIRTRIIFFILENTMAISIFGSVFLIMGISLIIGVILSARHRYYKIRSTHNAVWIDETLIQQLLDSYWKTLFPQQEIPNHLTIKNNQIHITANFPYYPYSEQKNLLFRIEKELAPLFAKTLGYQQSFFLSASFKDQDPRV